jgi:hypothetical protein
LDLGHARGTLLQAAVPAGGATEPVLRAAAGDPARHGAFVRAVLVAEPALEARLLREQEVGVVDDHERRGPDRDAERAEQGGLASRIASTALIIGLRT